MTSTDKDAFLAIYKEIETDLIADIQNLPALSDNVKQQLIDNTANSVARGNFGSPSFFVNEELYFGKDKLRDVEEEIVALLG